MAAVLKILKYHTQLQFDLSYKTIIGNYAKNIFLVMTSSMRSQGDLKFSLYIHFWRGSLREKNCKGNVSSIYENIVIVFRGYICLQEISINNTYSRSQDYVQRHRLTGTDYCSHHTVGVAGDDIMYHSRFVCVFVCLSVCLCVCQDVCPDDLTMTDWCHTNNIMQEYKWGCLIVQVVCYILMMSLMTSLGQ